MRESHSGSLRDHKKEKNKDKPQNVDLNENRSQKIYRGIVLETRRSSGTSKHSQNGGFQPFGGTILHIPYFSAMGLILFI